MSWAELKRTLAEAVALLPASDEEHEARMEATKVTGERVEYLGRPNYCGGWDQWRRVTNRETGVKEIVRKRMGSSCRNDPSPGTGQCSSCRTDERNSHANYMSTVQANQAATTAKKVAETRGMHAPRGMR